MEYTKGELVYNRYRLQEPLGDGGFSKVWKAVDEDAMTIVAIKLFSVRDAEGIEFCRSEYQQTFDLHHPHILKPSFFGVDRNVTPFLLMPFCSRGSLENRRLTEREIARLLLQLGSALAYLHGLPSPVVHYDLRPDNVLVNDAGEYMLSDFGISRKLELRLTKPMAGSGNYSRGLTPMPYRAPELCTTETDEHFANTRTDIWALGATAYYLATGMPPFLEQGGYAQNLHTGADNPLLSLPRHWPSSLSSSLLALITGCLSKASWERPDAQQLVDEANHFLLTGEWRRSSRSMQPPPLAHSQQNDQSAGTREETSPDAGYYTAPPWQRNASPKAPDNGRYSSTKVTGNRTAIVIAGGIGILVVLAMMTAAWRFASYQKWVKLGDNAWGRADWAAAEDAYAYAMGYSLFRTRQLEAAWHNARKERRLATYETVGRPAEGLLAVRDTAADGQLRWGYVDTSGLSLLIALLYDEAGSFENGKAWVRKDENRFQIDRQGKRLFSSQPEGPTPPTEENESKRETPQGSTVPPDSKPTMPPKTTPKVSNTRTAPSKEPKPLSNTATLTMQRAENCKRTSIGSASLQLRPAQETELKTITVYATDCGSLRLSLAGSHLVRSVSQGVNTINLVELDVRLQANNSYTLSLDVQPGGRCPVGLQPQLESESSCGNRLAGSSQLQINANPNNAIYAISYRY